MEERLVTGEQMEEESMEELRLRPLKLKESIGHNTAKKNLDIFIQAAKMREEALDHDLLYCPPGLVMTTPAAIIAHETDVQFRTPSAPAIERCGDAADILASLERGYVLFVEAVHRVPRSGEEALYPAMEDFFLAIVS